VLSGIYRHQGETILRLANQRVGEAERRLDQRVDEPYSFTVYASTRTERSINFAIVVEYMQRWQPVNYQPGRLAKTVTLAPKEARRYSTKIVDRRSRSEKETETRGQSRKSESTATSRADTEIVRKAQSQNNFNLTASGGYKTKVWNASASAAFTKNSLTNSRGSRRTSVSGHGHRHRPIPGGTRSGLRPAGEGGGQSRRGRRVVHSSRFRPDPLRGRPRDPGSLQVGPWTGAASSRAATEADGPRFSVAYRGRGEPGPGTQVRPDRHSAKGGSVHTGI
jgi:hypothetical protein